MGIISSMKQVLKRSFSYDQLKQQTRNIQSLASNVFSIEQPSHEKETFEEAVQRLKLTPDDLQRREQQFQRLVMIFSLLCLVLLAYLVWVLLHKAWIASLGTAGILLVVIAQLFRYHFWLFQVREKKLGCHFKEWFLNITGKKRENHP